MSATTSADMGKNLNSLSWEIGPVSPDPNNSEKDRNMPGLPRFDEDTGTWEDWEEYNTPEEFDEIVTIPAASVPTEPFRLGDLPADIYAMILRFVIEADELPATEIGKEFWMDDEYVHAMPVSIVPSRGHQAIMYMLFRGHSAMTADALHWREVLENVDTVRFARAADIVITNLAELLRRVKPVGPVQPLWPWLGTSAMLQCSKDVRRAMLDLNSIYGNLVLLELSGPLTVELIEAMYEAGIQILVAGAINDTDTRLKARIQLLRGLAPRGTVHKAVLRQVDLTKLVDLLLGLDKSVDIPAACCMMERMQCRIHLYNRSCPTEGLTKSQIQRLLGPWLKLEGFAVATLDGAQLSDDADSIVGQLAPPFMGRALDLPQILDDTKSLIADIEAEVGPAPTELSQELADFEKYATRGSELENFVRTRTLGSSAKLSFFGKTDQDWAESILELVRTKYLRPMVLLFDRRAEEVDQDHDENGAADLYQEDLYQEGLSMVKGVQWYLEELCDWFDMTLSELALAMHGNIVGDVYFLEALCEHGVWEKNQPTQEMLHAIRMANSLTNDHYHVFEDELVALDVETRAEYDNFDDESFLPLGRRFQPGSYRKRVRAAMRLSREEHAAIQPISAFRDEDSTWPVPCKTTCTPFVYPMGIGHLQAWCYPPSGLRKRIFVHRPLLLTQAPS